MACTQSAVSKFIWQDEYGNNYLDDKCTDQLTNEEINEELSLPYFDKEIMQVGRQPVKVMHVVLVAGLIIVAYLFFSKK